MLEPKIVRSEMTNEFLDERKLILTGLLYPKFREHIKEVSGAEVSGCEHLFSYEANIESGCYCWNINDVQNLVKNKGFELRSVQARDNNLILNFIDTKHKPESYKKNVDLDIRKIKQIAKVK